jgi:putative transposase
MVAHVVSQRRVCLALRFPRSTLRYQPTLPARDAPLRRRIEEIAAVRVRYGYKRIHTLLRREDWVVNHKRVYRLYKQSGLNLRRKRPRRARAAAHRQTQPIATRANECWAMDFMSDALFNGRRFRVFTAIDTFTRECLEIHAGQSIKGEDVAGILERLVTRHGLPERVQVDNGTEFVSKALDRWAYDHGVTLTFSRPGKPTDNAFIESFNGSFRDECLNVNWFLSLEDAREKIGLWRWDYNNHRPHSALGDVPPRTYAQRISETPRAPDPNP